MDFTPIARPGFIHLARHCDKWISQGEDIQAAQLCSLLRRACATEIGRRYNFEELSKLKDPYKGYAERVPEVEYEDIRELVMRMIAGERNVLWRGRCANYAQSSGTSGGRSKYIPITTENLARCHYRGAAYSVAHYLRANPKSRLFSGKAFVLGGSFAHTLQVDDPRVRIGDLSATLINKINPLANFFRVPDKHTALIPDWQEKLPALIEKSAYEDITNISGVPSWFLTVIKGVMELRGVNKISDVWPNLEVFFHGGISFEPYRRIYEEITDPAKMHFMDTYNASEGFFGVQTDLTDNSMLLIIDNDIFYEFQEIGSASSRPRTIGELEVGKIYEMIITSSNGLWRYRIGDTVRVVSTNPVKIKVAGRTKTFINAFGEELMEENAERAMAAACEKTGAEIANYTAAPVYATEGEKGHHQWIIEWQRAPRDTKEFGMVLDAELRKLNSDYDAKRSHTIFLDPPEIRSVPTGTFNRWLRSVGSGKLGGQRKVPRLSNNRTTADALLTIV